MKSSSQKNPILERAKKLLNSKTYASKGKRRTKTPAGLEKKNQEESNEINKFSYQRNKGNNQEVKKIVSPKNATKTGMYNSGPSNTGLRKKSPIMNNNRRKLEKEGGEGKIGGKKKAQKDILENLPEVETNEEKEFQEYLKEKEKEKDEQVDEIMNAHDMILGMALQNLSYKDSAGFNETKTEREYKKRIQNKGRNKTRPGFNNFGIQNLVKKKVNAPIGGVRTPKYGGQFKKKTPKKQTNLTAPTGNLRSSRKANKTGISRGGKRVPATQEHKQASPVLKKQEVKPPVKENELARKEYSSLIPSMTKASPTKGTQPARNHNPYGLVASSVNNLKKPKNRPTENKEIRDPIRISKNFAKESYLDNKPKPLTGDAGRRAKRKSKDRKGIRYVGKKTFLGKATILNQNYPINDPRHPEYGKDFIKGSSKKPSNNDISKDIANFSQKENESKGGNEEEVIPQPQIFSNLHIVNSNVYFPIINPNQGQHQPLFPENVEKKEEVRRRAISPQSKTEIKKRMRSLDGVFRRVNTRGKNLKNIDGMSFEFIEKKSQIKGSEKKPLRKRLDFTSEHSSAKKKTNIHLEESMTLGGKKNKSRTRGSSKIRMVKSLKSSTVFGDKKRKATKNNRKKEKRRTDEELNNISFEVSVSNSKKSY